MKKVQSSVRISINVVGILACILVFPNVLKAQKNTMSLDYSKNPTYGEITLDTSFGREAHIQEVTSGGEVNASYLGGECSGFASDSPDFRLDWQGSASRLSIGFIADDPSKDATIIINTPDGSWICNDDAEGLNPVAVIENPAKGQYDIWIGSFEDGSYITGKLIIIDLEKFNVGSGEVNLDYTLDPQYGTITLTAGFNPDPHATSGISGGAIDVKNLGLGSSECIGYASKAPDFRLNWTGSTSSLVIRFEANNPSEDTVLLINTPDGKWICNDDANSGTLNPSLRLNGQLEGQYDIWVASLSNGSYVEGKLIVTER
jgi:hypothetical protein